MGLVLKKVAEMLAGTSQHWRDACAKNISQMIISDYNLPFSDLFYSLSVSRHHQVLFAEEGVMFSLFLSVINYLCCRE
jgi:hypothetical protein